MTKAVNYTEAMTKVVVEGYEAGTAVETLAEKVGRSVKSVVAKLVREGVYVKAEAGTKATGVTKAAMVAEVGVLIGTEVPGLEKALRVEIEAILGALKTMATTIVALKVEALKAETE